MRTTFAITHWTAFLAIFLAPSVVTVLSDMLDEPGGSIAYKWWRAGDLKVRILELVCFNERTER